MIMIRIYYIRYKNIMNVYRKSGGNIWPVSYWFFLHKSWKLIQNNAGMIRRQEICFEKANQPFQIKNPEVNARCIRHFHIVFDVASCFLNLSNSAIKTWNTSHIVCTWKLLIHVIQGRNYDFSYVKIWWRHRWHKRDEVILVHQVRFS